MLESNSKKIRLWSEIALSVITVILGIVFICIVADIYYSGKGTDVIYSPEIVKARLLPLIAPLVIWVLGVIACFVLSIFFPSYEKKGSKVSTREKINKLKDKLPSSGNENYEKEKKFYNGFERIRCTLYILATAFSIVSAIITIIYISTVSYFAEKEINEGVLDLVRICGPFILVSFLLFAIAVVYEIITAKFELSAMTKMMVHGKGNAHIESIIQKSIKSVRFISAKHNAQIVWGVRGIVITVALVFIVLGILNGGVEDVWSKAINICTECIGLG